MEKFLSFVGYMLVLLAVVPLTGLLCFGNVKQAVAYTKDWLRVIAGIVVLAAIGALAFWPFMPPPIP